MTQMVFKQCSFVLELHLTASAVEEKALDYQSEGHGFKSQWAHRFFCVEYNIFTARLRVKGAFSIALVRHFCGIRIKINEMQIFKYFN